MSEDPFQMMAEANLASVSAEKARSFLERLLGNIEERPISAPERNRVGEILTMLLALHEDIQVEHSGLVDNVRNRLQFGYIPPVSCPSFLSIDPNLNTCQSSPELSIVNRSPQIQESPSLTMPPDIYAVVPEDQLMKCVVQRSKSSMRTVSNYRLYLNTSDETGILSCKESNFLLGSRKVAAGLSVQYVWSVADMKEWREKTAISKITRSNYVSYAKLIDPTAVENHSGCGRIAVAVRSPDKLVLVNAALVLSADAVEDISLLNSIEALSSGGPPASRAGSGSSAISDVAAGTAPVLLLRSRMPRKVHASEITALGANNDTVTNVPTTGNLLSEASLFGSTPADKDIYAMDFIGGGENRIREASRKNVVVEGAGYVFVRVSDSAASVVSDASGGSGHGSSHGVSGVLSPSAFNADQQTTFGGARAVCAVPTMQLGKMGDELFCLEFTQLSPYQAFVIALAVFEF